MTTYTTLLNSELPVWAEDGDLEQPTSGKVATGWEGEEKPAHEYMNWELNKHDRFILSILQEGMSTWRAGFPYVEKSLTKGSSGSIFIAKGESIDEDPEEDIAGTYWKKLIDSEGVLSAADVSAYMLNLLSSEDADEAIAELGGTAVGSAVFKAVNAEAARTAIGGSVFQDRANHTGTQAISTVSGLQTALDAKELLSNKVITLVGANDTTYPTSKAVADAISVAASGENYLGEWNAATNTPTLVDSTGTEGDYYRVSVAGTTEIDGIDDWSLGDEIIFQGGAWLKRPNFFPSLTTDDVTEATSKYFTESRVRGTVLTGLSLLSSTAITALDSLLSALGKLQGQITNLFARVPPAGGSTGQALTKASSTDYDYAWTTVGASLTFPVSNLGERATSTSETVALDCTTHNDWNVSLNTANTSGTLTLNITNIPDTANSKYVGYIRLIRGARKTVVFSAPAGKTWNWTSASTPSFTSTTGEYDVVMFYNQLNEAKIHAMVIDTGVI